jgi:hypothetical protein
LVGIKTYTTSGAFGPVSFDAGTVSCMVKIVGGGGAGGGITSTASLPGSANTDWDGAGGGAGGYCEGFVNGLTPASTFSGTVGAGGTGGVPTLSGTTANVICTAPASSAGGASTLTIGSTTFTANGGSAGPSSEMSAPNGGPSIHINGGTGGTASGGSINITGSTGGDCVITWEGSNQTDYSGSGGGSIFGTGGFGNLTRDPTVLSGLPGTGVGSGGSGACVAHAAYPMTANGGSGATGIVIIYEYQ